MDVVKESDAVRIQIMDGSGFIQGVWCGAIFGAAIMMLIVSLIFESSQRRQERQSRHVRKIWGEGLSVATVLAQTPVEHATDYRGRASA